MRPANTQVRSTIPLRAARRPRAPVAASPSPSDQENEPPQRSPVAPARNQQAPSKPSKVFNNLPDDDNNGYTPQTSFAQRRLTLPRPIFANTPTQPQASTSRAQPRRSAVPTQTYTPHNQTPQTTGTAQRIYPALTPGHRIAIVAAAMSTPVRRRASASSVDSGSSNFPYPGTKADSVNRLLREEHKRTPYTAMPGSRAAALLTQEMSQM